jgi:heme/copper-type cytochrome/quinol oxidase subunit 2
MPVAKRPAVLARPVVRTSRVLLAAVIVAFVAAVPPAGSLAAGQRTLSAQDDRRREVALRVTDAGFEPARIDARLNDIVAVTLTSGDIPHGLSLDEYRVAKRVEPGKPLRFEFRADTTGTFRFYCSLTGADGRPHDEHGELVVRR